MPAETAEDFVRAAITMQRRAEIAAIRGELKLSLSYCRRRNYAADKARRLGARVYDVWSQVDAARATLRDVRGLA